MKFKHSHPINIIEYTSRFLVLLVFPIIRALFLTKMDFYTWLQGAWFDLLVLLTIISLGVIAWWRYTYHLDDDGIHIKKGILLVKRRFIPYKKLSVVSVENPFYFIPIHAVRVTADTNGGLPTVPDFKITILKSELGNIISHVTQPFKNGSQLKRVYYPKNRYITLLSFLVSNSLTGVLFVSTFISGLGKVLGKEFENQVVVRLTSIAKFLAFGVPPIAATIGLAILGGWGVSFIVNLIRHLKFSVVRQGTSLDIKSGLVTKRRYLISVKRINLIELRQSLFTKTIGIYTALIHSNGYGKKRDELSILMPAGRRADISQNFCLLLPEIPINKPTLKPDKKRIVRFVWPSILLSIIISVAWIFAYNSFPKYNSVILFIGLMAQLPCLWFVVVRFFAFGHTGIGLANEVYTFTYTKAFRFKTISVPRNRVVKVKIRQSPFQIKNKSCDVLIYTFSEGKKLHLLQSLRLSDVIEILGSDLNKI